MSDNQGSGGGALETHHYINGGFGPPPSSGKDPFCPTSTNGGHLTDISGDTHLTLLKSNPGLNSFSSFEDGIGSRLPDTFMEMRYIDLGSWDLAGYTAEGLTSRLIDNRSLTDSPDNIIQYRPWEKPDSSSPVTLGITTTTSSPSHLNLTPNGNGIMTSATSNGKSPTLTTLTNAFPTFSDTFGSLNGQKPLPSFQSQFNSFNEPPPGHHTNNNHHGNNGDINNHQQPVTTGPPSLPSFHTLPANHRGYVHQAQPTLLASGPVHRDLSNIQPQFLDDRHIQLFPGQILAAGPPVTNPGMQINGNGQHFVTTTNNLCGPPGHHFVGGAPPPTQLVELVSMPPMQLHSHYPHPPAHPHAKLQPQTTDGSIPGLNLNDLHHHTQNSNLNLNLNGPPSGPGGKYDGPIESVIAVKIPHANNYDHQQQLNNHAMHPHHLQHPIKMEHQQQTPQSSPQIVTNSTTNGNGLGNHQHHNNHHSTPNNTNGPTPKRQQKRKRNAESVDNSAYQHHNNNHQHQNHNNSHNNNDLNNDAQVSSVSSSDSDFKRPNLGLNGNGLDDSGLDKPVKKKRKRCGECVGCQKKDNCGDCAPCRNDKSHQICKMRRCEKLTEKKNRVGRGMKQQQQQQQH